MTDPARITHINMSMAQLEQALAELPEEETEAMPDRVMDIVEEELDMHGLLDAKEQENLVDSIGAKVSKVAIDSVTRQRVIDLLMLWQSVNDSLAAAHAKRTQVDEPSTSAQV